MNLRQGALIRVVKMSGGREFRMSRPDEDDRTPRAPTVHMFHSSDEMYGADRVVVEVARVMLSEWQSEDIVCWLPNDLNYPERRFSKALRDLGISVRFAPLPVLRRSYSNPNGMALLLRECIHAMSLDVRKGDIVYLTTSAMAAIAPIARAKGATVLLHVHECWEGPDRLMLGVLAGGVDRFICVSRAVLRRLPGRLRFRARVIHNGFRFEEVSAHESTSPGRPIRFLMASRWNSWKGHREFLRAWELADRPDARLVILGGPPPAGECADVWGLVSRLANHGTVDIVGHVDDVTSYVKEADVVVVPSIRPDPLPTIAIEAQCLGRAVMASNVGGLPEIVKPDETGWLLSAGDIDQWSRMIRSATLEEAAYFGAQAGQLVRPAFSIQRFERAIHAELRSIRTGWD